MSLLLAAAEADPTSWPDVVALGLVLAFCLGMTWLITRWFW